MSKDIIPAVTEDADTNMDDLIVQEVKSAEEDSLVTIELKAPVDWMGCTYEKLTFDFDKLTGRDSLNVENELKSRGKAVMTPAFDANYLVRIAARACEEKLGVDFFESLPIVDFNRIRNAARTFMLRSEL